MIDDLFLYSYEAYFKEGLFKKHEQNPMKCTSHEGSTCNPSGQLNSFFRFDILHVRHGTTQFSGERNCKHEYFWLDRTQGGTLFMCLLFKPKCFVDRCLSFCPFSFGHCLVFPSSVYGFWLPLLYLQILLWFSLLLILVIREKRVKLYNVIYKL